MSTNSRAANLRRRVFQTVLAFASVAVISCVSTPPLVLQPTVRPLDFAPEERHDRLHMVSFVDELPDYDGGLKRKTKVFRDSPAGVYNDTLLNSLRLSQGFEAVDRDQAPAGGGYILEGRLITLDTQESFFKTQTAPSTMEMSANCVAEFQLKDAATGEILLEETVTGTGEGWVESDRGGVSTSLSVNSSGGVSTNTTSSQGDLDETTGYQNSMSAAISNNVHRVTELVIKELSRRGTAGTPTAREDGPQGGEDR